MMAQWSYRAGALLVAQLVCVSPALAQSAADKATARTQATQAIELYRAGEYTQALDKMQRAQALFDAPVHLLYIARAQARLGKLVEASETYRTLSRTQLEADAPPAFINAVHAAQTELPEVEQRIPKLLIRVTPAHAGNKQLTLDGKPLPVEVIGIERPVNPGAHSLMVSADGYKKFVRELNVEEGRLEELEVELEQETAPEAAVDASAEPPPEEPTKKKIPMALLLGARLGGAIPGGKLPGEVVRDRSMQPAFGDVAAPGGELELRIGATLLKHFGLFLYGSGQSLREGDNDAVYADAPELQAGAPTLTSAGVAASAGTEQGKFGGYAEVGISFVRNMQYSTVGQVGGQRCRLSVSLHGSGLRAGAGMNIPLSEIFHLTPYAAFSFGGFRDMSVTDENDCVSRLQGTPAELSLEAKVADSPTASVFTLGVGLDYFLEN